MSTQSNNPDKATPGPYRYNPSQGAVFTLAPGVADLHEDDTEHYGGPLICESIAKPADGYQIVAAPEMRRVLELVLLFYADGWDTSGESQARWEALGGGEEATSKALCDRVRAALAVATGEAESVFGLPPEKPVG